MKYLKYLLLTLCLFCIACKQEKPNDDEILSSFLDTLMLDDEINTDIDLPLSKIYQEKTITLVWLSHNPEIITNDGKIALLEETALASLEVTAHLNETQKIKTFDIFVLQADKNTIAEDILAEIIIPTETTEDIILPTRISYNNKNYNINWTSNNQDIIKNNGNIVYANQDKTASLKASINYQGESFSKDFLVTVLKLDDTPYHNALDTLITQTKIENDLNLPLVITVNNKSYLLSWNSSNPDILSNTGKIGFCKHDTTVTLTVSLVFDNINLSKQYNITVTETSALQLLENLINEVEIPTKTANDIYLKTEFGYDITATWSSSNINVISNQGKISSAINNTNQITLILTLQLGGQTMTKDFKLVVTKEQHMYIDRTFDGTKENLSLNELGKLVLASNQTQGIYTSNEITVEAFKDAVASWSAITSKQATCEMEIRLKIDGIWSDYITYGKWGLGLQNGSSDQTKGNIKLATDEIMVLNSKTATAFQMKLTLRRDNPTVDSPVVSLIALTINFASYSYTLDRSILKGETRYNVPKLYQHEVPSIGNIICSATCTTMLLKYQGHSFAGLANYEHQYMAALVKDYLNNIYGNWVFNCVTMGALGENSYVKRFYSLTELLYHLDHVGPIAASIKGPAGNPVYYSLEGTSEIKSYTTNGHLITVTGYQIKDGQVILYINDPNVLGVAVTMTETNYMNVWRNIAYIVE